LNVQLYDDDVAERIGLGDAASRARQLRALVDAYGLARNRRARLVDQIAEIAIHAARQEAVDAGVHHETAVAVADNGFPFLWAITWRARSASWVLRNRDLFERALTQPTGR
jgi:hypothetical protein